MERFLIKGSDAACKGNGPQGGVQWRLGPSWSPGVNPELPICLLLLLAFYTSVLETLARRFPLLGAALLGRAGQLSQRAAALESQEDQGQAQQGEVLSNSVRPCL